MQVEQLAYVGPIITPSGVECTVEMHFDVYGDEQSNEQYYVDDELVDFTELRRRFGSRKVKQYTQRALQNAR